jgi:hypothetical protein
MTHFKITYDVGLLKFEYDFDVDNLGLETIGQLLGGKIADFNYKYFEKPGLNFIKLLGAFTLLS